LLLFVVVFIVHPYLKVSLSSLYLLCASFGMCFTVMLDIQRSCTNLSLRIDAYLKLEVNKSECEVNRSLILSLIIVLMLAQCWC